jgi:hypothetical protein
MRIGTSSKVLVAITLVCGVATAESWLPTGAKPMTVIDVSRDRGRVKSTFSRGLSQGIRPGDKAYFLDKTNREVKVFNQDLYVEGVSANTAWVPIPDSAANWTIANGTGGRYELMAVPGRGCSEGTAAAPSGAALANGNADWGAANVDLEPFEKETPGLLKADGLLRAGFDDGVIPRARAFVVVDGALLGAAKVNIHWVTKRSARFDVTHIPESLANKGVRIVFAKGKC